MASSIIQKLFRNQSHSATRIIPLLNKPFSYEQPPLPTAPVLTHLVESETRARQFPFLLQAETKDLSLSPSHSSQFYPSFSIAFFLNPICSTGLVRLDHDIVTDDSASIWADSVKKKRKRKMNKHKLRKLRRRLKGKS